MENKEIIENIQNCMTTNNLYSKNYFKNYNKNYKINKKFYSKLREYLALIILTDVSLILIFLNYYNCISITSIIIIIIFNFKKKNIIKNYRKIYSNGEVYIK